MNNSLAIVNGNEWQAMLQVADALVSSGFLPRDVGTPQKAVAIILAGRELGIGPWQALQSINVIQGKPTVSPQLMLALINRSGELEDMTVDGDAKGCTVMMKRRGRTPHIETFTMADAQAMGLASKDNYKKQPATMLQWRCVAKCARIVFSDVILNLYTPDEMGADVTVTDDGGMQVITVAPEPESPKGRDRSKDAERLGNGGGRRVTTTTNEAPRGGLSDPKKAREFIERWRDFSLTDSDVLAALGVTKLSQWTDSYAAANDAVAKWHEHQLEAELTPSNVTPFPGSTDDDAPYLVRAIEFQRVNGQPRNLSCVLHADDGTNIVIYSSDPFRKAGFSESDIAAWKESANWSFETPLKVRGRLVKNKTNDGLTWQDVTIDAGQNVAEADKQFANI